jgi:hypothetical protein
VEVMLNTPLISDLIEKGEIGGIKKAMIKAKILGCQTFDDALFDLAQSGKISVAEALQNADSRNDLSLRLRLEGDFRKTKLKKNIAYAKHVDFTDYRTFMIRRLSVPDELVDRVASVEDAIRNTLSTKGLKESSQRPDIELQYVFTSKAVEPEKMDDVDDAVSSGIDVESEVRKHGTLKINIVDLDTRKAVWQVIASRELAVQPRPQNAINQDMDMLFDEFPPRPLEIVG